MKGCVSSHHEIRLSLRTYVQGQLDRKIKAGEAFGRILWNCEYASISAGESSTQDFTCALVQVTEYPAVASRFFPSGHEPEHSASCQ
jgi:hypothetical protein